MDKNERQQFALAIYDVVQTIPFGRATSYGAIAKAIGYPTMSRLVGKVMSECNSAETGIPAHRVVNSQGVLSGKEAFGLGSEMQQLLESEGVTIVDHKIKNWKSVYWNPMDEINL